MAKLNASVDGIAKSGDRYSFALALPKEAADSIISGKAVTVQGVKVEIVGNDGEHAVFEIRLSELAGTALADVDVGDTVVIEG